MNLDIHVLGGTMDLHVLGGTMNLDIFDLIQKLFCYIENTNELDSRHCLYKPSP